jgi:hypothetical protein
MRTRQFAPADGCLLLTDGQVLHVFRSGEPAAVMPVAGVHAWHANDTQLAIRNAYTPDLTLDLDPTRCEAARAFGAELLEQAERAV